MVKASANGDGNSQWRWQLPMVKASANVWRSQCVAMCVASQRERTLLHTLTKLVSHTQGKTQLRLEPLGYWTAEAGRLGVVQQRGKNYVS